MWNRFQDAFHQGKRTIGHMWNHAVKFAGQLDHAVGVGRRVYGALQPALQDLGINSQVSGALMHGFKAYDRGKADTMGLHNNVSTHLNRLRKAAPELDLD